MAPMTHRRYLQGPTGCLWLFVCLVFIVWGLSAHGRWSSVGVGRELAIRERAVATEDLRTLDVQLSAAGAPLESGARPRLLARTLERMHARRRELDAARTIAESTLQAAERAFGRREDPERVQDVFRIVRDSFLAVGLRAGRLAEDLRRLLDAGPRARAALDSFPGEAEQTRRRLDEAEAREVPGLREKYGLPDDRCRFRLPEARALVEDAERERRRAEETLRTPVEPEGIPDEPEAAHLAERAYALLGSARAAAERRLQRSRECNEQYDRLRAALDGWPERTADAQAAARAIWAEFLPRYHEGLVERAEAANDLRPEIERRLALEIPEYLEQDFDGALEILAGALEQVNAAEAHFAAAPDRLGKLRRARTEIPPLLQRATAMTQSVRTYVATHASDVKERVPDGAEQLQIARSHAAGTDWLEAQLAAQSALTEAAAGLARAQVLVADADSARRRQEEVSRRSHSTDSSSDSYSSGGSWDSGSSDSGSWGDSGSDSGW